MQTQRLGGSCLRNILLGHHCGYPVENKILLVCFIVEQHVKRTSIAHFYARGKIVISGRTFCHALFKNTLTTSRAPPDLPH